MKLIVFHRSNTAVSYYRLFMPAKWLRRLDGWTTKVYPDWHTWDRLLATPKAIVDIQADAAGSDLMLFQWGYGPHEIQAMQAMRERTGAPALFDLDDDVLAVPAGHQSFEAFKARKPDECMESLQVPIEAIPLLSQRGWQVGHHKETGVPLVVRQTALDFPQVFTEGTRQFDGMIASTPHILDKYHEYLAPGATAADAPNCFDPEDWSSVKRAPLHPKPTILWAGSNAHGDNVRLIFPALRRVLKAVPDARLVVMGAALPAWQELGAPVEYAGWVTWRHYHAALASHGAWVGIAPMTDEPFNWAKSHIRWMEYALAGIPCVGSPAPEFKKWAYDAYLAATTQDEWAEGLTSLLHDATMRGSLRARAEEAARERCDIRKHIGAWVDILKAAAQKGVIVRAIPGNERGAASANLRAAA